MDVLPGEGPPGAINTSCTKVHCSREAFVFQVNVFFSFESSYNRREYSQQYSTEHTQGESQWAVPKGGGEWQPPRQEGAATYGAGEEGAEHIMNGRR